MTSAAKMLTIALFGTLLATASAMAQTVNVDYDHSVNFLKFKSYKIEKVHATDPGVESRLTIAIDRDLQSRYLHAVDKDPDILVGVVESNADSKEYANFFDAMDGLSWQRGWGTSSGFMDGEAGPQDIPAGTLVFNMWDGKTKKLIWRGTIAEPASVTNNKEADQKMDKAIGQLLAQFPPKFKK